MEKGLAKILRACVRLPLWSDPCCAWLPPALEPLRWWRAQVSYGSWAPCMLNDDPMGEMTRISGV